MLRASAAKRALLVVIAAASSGCAGDPTQLVVHVATDLVAPSEVDALRIRVFPDASATATHDRTVTLSDGGDASMPTFRSVLSLEVDPPGGDIRPVRVVAEASRGGMLLFPTEVRAGFASARRLRLDLYVARRCVAQAETCLPDQTCGANGCVSPEVMVTSLSDDTGDTAPTGDDPRRP